MLVGENQWMTLTFSFTQFLPREALLQSLGLLSRLGVIVASINATILLFLMHNFTNTEPDE